MDIGKSLASQGILQWFRLLLFPMNQEDIFQFLC